jgi:hypothetical protein
MDWFRGHVCVVIAALASPPPARIIASPDCKDPSILVPRGGLPAVGSRLAARGPDDIVKRLKVGLEPLAGYENHDGILVSNGCDVMYEHSETWNWKSGETAVLQFVSVHRVEDGKVTLWKDYWDMGGLTAHAPPTWLEDLGTADTS